MNKLFHLKNGTYNKAMLSHWIPSHPSSAHPSNCTIWILKHGQNQALHASKILVLQAFNGLRVFIPIHKYRYSQLLAGFNYSCFECRQTIPAAHTLYLLHGMCFIREASYLNKPKCLITEPWTSSSKFYQFPMRWILIKPWRPKVRW